MNLNRQQSEVLKKFSPAIETFNKPVKVWVSLLLILIVLAIYALYVQIAEGHGVTGMRDNVVWGLFIVNFIFFIGLSYAGAIIAALLHISKVTWCGPVARLAQLMTFISVIVGPIFILLCIGRLDRLHHLFIYPRLQSPMTWDVIAILTYLVGTILFLYLALIKDFALYRDSNINIPKWRHKVYDALSLNYHGAATQKRSILLSQNLLAIILIPLSIVVSSILSWVFGMTLRPGWHSTIFGPYFVLAAIYSGVGVLIILMWVFRRIYNLTEYFHDSHFVNMGYIMLVLAAGYGYFTFSEYLTSWYSSEKWDNEVVMKLVSLKEYGWLFLFANTVGIVLPIVVVAIPKFRKPGLIALAAAFMVLAMWLKRFLIIVPTLETPLLPMQDTRIEYINYSATWVEWALTFGGVATFLLLFTLASKFMTIISVSELESEKDAYVS